MVCCAQPVEPTAWADLPGPPLTTVPCPSCGGVGAHLCYHPLYASAEPCVDCYGQGEWLVDSEGDAQ